MNSELKTKLEAHETYTVVLVNNGVYYYLHHDSRGPSVYLYSLYKENSLLFKKYKTTYTKDTFDLFYECLVKYNYKILFYTKQEWKESNINITNTVAVDPEEALLYINTYLKVKTEIKTDNFIELFNKKYTSKYSNTVDENIILKEKHNIWLIPYIGNYSILTFNDYPINNLMYRVMYNPINSYNIQVQFILSHILV